MYKTTLIYSYTYYMATFEIKQNFKETALHTGIPSKQNGLITDDDVLYKQMLYRWESISKTCFD